MQHMITPSKPILGGNNIISIPSTSEGNILMKTTPSKVSYTQQLRLSPDTNLTMNTDSLFEDELNLQILEKSALKDMQHKNRK